MKELDMKDIAILDAFPTYNWNQDILEVGCGDGKLDFHLWSKGFRVYATDIQKYDTWQDEKNLSFYIADIFDLSSFQIKSASVVIASQVLEHLPGWKLALVHLIALASVRVIITVPHRRSFFSPEHVNFWADELLEAMPDYLPSHTSYKDIHEFVDLCAPYSVTISKIRTKPQDVGDTYDYLMVIDKRQNQME